MFRFLLLTTVPLALLLALLTTAALALSHGQPLHPISTQLAWCGEHYICWLGINTTQTSMESARHTLITTGYQQSAENRAYYSSTDCTARLMPVADHPEQIGAIGVQCADFRVAEIMSALGTPDRVGFTCDGNYILYYGYNLILNIGSTLSPNQPVELMALSNIISGAYRRRWFGFALPWRYPDRFC